MKNVYSVIFAVCVCLMTFSPQRSFAQCLCTGGIAPTKISYSTVLSPTNASSSTVSFPKFDPSIGTLTCVDFYDTISGITTTTVWNLASSKTNYEFLLTIANNITGPGVTVNEIASQIYGPDSLNAMGNSPGDSIVYGPNSLFTNVKDHKNTSNTAPYLGASGTVDFVYTLNGGLISLIGSLNYGDQIVTNYWGSFGITYSWCPASPLATLISNFTAAKNGNYVQMKWQAPNEQNNIVYHIEYSTDGSQYFQAGTLQSDSSSQGNAANYQFMYSIPQNSQGELFFRIKRIGGDGQSFIYSAVKTVNLKNGGIPSMQAYPNPVKSYTMIEFDQLLSGDFIVNLVNTTGQVLQQKAVTLSGANQIRLDLNSHPATGIYYLQVKDRTNNQQYITKLIIE